jgi:hypothetical protein
VASLKRNIPDRSLKLTKLTIGQTCMAVLVLRAVLSSVQIWVERSILGPLDHVTFSASEVIMVLLSFV